MTPVGQSGHRIPTIEDENRFWALVEQAWSRAGDTADLTRRSLASRAPDADVYAAFMVIDGAAGDFLRALAELCDGMSADELADLDRVVERKLYDIDRADIQAVTDGSDDGFLYARGLIVALGRDFYTAVAADPSVAIIDGELESMCYFFAHLHEEKYGTWPERVSGICRESCSNPAGWAGA